MNTLFYAFLLVSLVAIGEALKCNQCISLSSWAACDDHAKKVDCLYGITDCIKIYGKYRSKTKEEFVKGCAKTCNKYDVAVCHNGDADCKIHCCDSDYCNAGSSLSSASVSFTVLVTAAGTVALIFGKII